jgi:hypothetical protein
MLSKKEIGMIALAGAGLLGVGYFTGGIGGGGQTGERVGTILGSPSGLPSSGVSSPKLGAALTKKSLNIPIKEGAKSVVTPDTIFTRPGIKGDGEGFKVYSPKKIPSAVTQPYITGGGSAYVAPTYHGVGGSISKGGHSYTSPTQKGAGGLTAKGAATKKKVAVRQASGFTSYSG